MKSFRDIRVIPVVLVAFLGLAVLKVAGLVIDGGYVFDYQPQTTRPSWAQETFNFPTGKNNAADITGSVQEKPREEVRQTGHHRGAGSGQARRRHRQARAEPAGVSGGARDSRAAAVAAPGA